MSYATKDRKVCYTKHQANEALLRFTLETLESQYGHPQSGPAQKAVHGNNISSSSRKGFLHLLEQICAKSKEFEIVSASVVYPKWTSSCSNITIRDIRSEPRQTLTAVISPQILSFGVRLAIVQSTLVILLRSYVTAADFLRRHILDLEGWSPPSISLKFRLAGMLLPSNSTSENLRHIALTLMLVLTLESLKTLPLVRWISKALQPTVVGFCIWFLVNGWFSDVGSNPGAHGKQKSDTLALIDQIEKSLSKQQIKGEQLVLQMLRRGLRIKRSYPEDDLFQLVLLWAIRSDYTDLIACVLRMGSMAPTTNATSEGDLTVRELDQALHACTIDENIEVMATNKADRRSSALPLAAFRADEGSSAQLEIMKLLLTRGVDADSCDTHGSTSMHYCIVRPDPVQLLLDNGATTEVRDSKGKAPLHCAFGIRGNYLDSADVLIHAGADIEFQDSQGRTPLLCAIYESGSVDAVSWLIERGANVDVCGTRNPL